VAVPRDGKGQESGGWSQCGACAWCASWPDQGDDGAATRSAEAGCWPCGRPCRAN